jgi:hypothetical protein
MTIMGATNNLQPNPISACLGDTNQESHAETHCASVYRIRTRRSKLSLDSSGNLDGEARQ